MQTMLFMNDIDDDEFELITKRYFYEDGVYYILDYWEYDESPVIYMECANQPIYGNMGFAEKGHWSC